MIWKNEENVLIFQRCIPEIFFFFEVKGVREYLSDYNFSHIKQIVGMGGGVYV